MEVETNEKRDLIRLEIASNHIEEDMNKIPYHKQSTCFSRALNHLFDFNTLIHKLKNKEE